MCSIMNVLLVCRRIERHRKAAKIVRILAGVFVAFFILSLVVLLIFKSTILGGFLGSGGAFFLFFTAAYAGECFEEKEALLSSTHKIWELCSALNCCGGSITPAKIAKMKPHKFLEFCEEMLVAMALELLVAKGSKGAGRERRIEISSETFESNLTDFHKRGIVAGSSPVYLDRAEFQLRKKQSEVRRDVHSIEDIPTVLIK